MARLTLSDAVPDRLPAFTVFRQYRIRRMCWGSFCTSPRLGVGSGRRARCGAGRMPPETDGIAWATSSSVGRGVALDNRASLERATQFTRSGDASGKSAGAGMRSGRTKREEGSAVEGKSAAT
jgi:hypothetical protein